MELPPLLNFIARLKREKKNWLARLGRWVADAHWRSDAGFPYFPDPTVVNIMKKTGANIEEAKTAG